jgi:hypothetical protein
MANVVVDEGQFTRMRNALKEWNARRPAGEAEAMEVYKSGNKAQGVLSFAGAQAPMLQPLLAGAVIYAVVTSSYFDKIEIFKNQWFMKPLLVLGLGYYLFRKNSPWAQAVLAAAGILFLKGYYERPEAKKEAAAAKEAAVAKEAAGPDDEDAGRWEWDRRDEWRDREREREHWRHAERRAQRIEDRRVVHQAERLADRVFENARAA